MSLLVALLVISGQSALLVSCGQAQTGEENAILKLSFGSAARAFAPPAALVSTYNLSATGPGGQKMSAESSSPALTLELEPGDWTILVEGRSAAGARLVSGSITVHLGPGDRQNATIILLPEGGTGSLSLAWSTKGDPGPGYRAEGVLRSQDGVLLPLSGQGSAGSLTLPEVAAGSWTLELGLAGAPGRIAGLADSILIVAGCETRVTVVFEPPAGHLALALVGPDFEAKSIAISPPVRRVAPGTEADFALPPGAGPGSWYGEGLALAESGPRLALVSRTEGRTRIDWVAGTAFAAASGRAEMISGPPVTLGPFAWVETLVRADLSATAASKALDGCRDLAFAPDGASLFLSGKDGTCLSRVLIGTGATASPTLASSVAKAELPELEAPTRIVAAPGFALSLLEGSARLLALSLEGSGEMTAIGSLQNPDFATARSLVLSLDAATAYLVSEGSDALLRVALSPDGRPLAAVRIASPGDPGLEALDRPLSLALSMDGTTLALGTAGDDALYLFSRDPGSGNLSFRERLGKEAFLPLASLSDVVDLAFSPDGASLYVLSYYGKCLIRLDQDQGGAYRVVAAAKSGVAGISGFDYPKRLALDPSGSLAAVSGSGAADGLVIFGIGGAAELAFLGVLLPDGSDGRPSRPGALAFSPDGQLLAVASPDDDRLTIFARGGP